MIIDPNDLRYFYQTVARFTRVNRPLGLSDTRFWTCISLDQVLTFDPVLGRDKEAFTATLIRAGDTAVAILRGSDHQLHVTVITQPGTSLFGEPTSKKEATITTLEEWSGDRYYHRVSHGHVALTHALLNLPQPEFDAIANREVDSAGHKTTPLPRVEKGDGRL